MGGEVAGVYARREAEAVQDAVVVVPDAQVVAVEVSVNTICPGSIAGQLLFKGEVSMMNVSDACMHMLAWSYGPGQTDTHSRGNVLNPKGPVA